MKAAVLHGPHDLRVEDVPDARVEEPTDAVVRVTHASVCGSDLHRYRGTFAPTGTARPGHEFLGVVEEVGTQVAGVQPGDLVVSPFSISCGLCPPCLAGHFTSCDEGDFFGGDTTPGAQAESVRVPHADGTLWAIPPAMRDEALFPALLLLGDVAGTGEHAARMGQVAAGDVVVVVGDGAVGCLAVAAARRRDPELVVAVGHHPDRLALASQFGADVLVDGRDVHVVDEVVALTGGRSADVVLETVGGGQEPLDLALALVRDFGRIASVGVFEAGPAMSAREAFGRNLTVSFGVAPTRAYLDDLAALIASGVFDPSPVLTDRLPLVEAAQAYRQMTDRSALKVLLTP